MEGGLQRWAALLLVVLVIAPAFGLLVERVLMRGLGSAPVSVSLVVALSIPRGSIRNSYGGWNVFVV